MFAWIGTRLFYAIIFFSLGAWAATVSPGMKHVVREATQIGSQAFDAARDWTLKTLRSEKETAAAPESSAAKPAPAAAAPESSAVKPAPAPATPQVPVAADLLEHARQAYANHDILGAINAYRGYIDRNPNSVAARGELGNVYFASGRLRDAGQMYFEAAMIKLRAGDIQGAKAMVGTVRKGDSGLADDLVRQIAQAQANKK